MSELRRVGLNLLFLVPGETGGMRVYSSNLIRKLAETSPDLELVVFVGREGAEVAELEFDGAEVVTIDVSAYPMERRLVAEQRIFPEVVRDHRLDLLHSLGTWSPIDVGAASVVTVHDVIYARFPRMNSSTAREDWVAAARPGAQAADRVIAPSEAAATDITSLLGVPRDRIDVIHQAGKPLGPATPETELREKLGLGDAAVVLCVSPRRAHKNTVRLFRAVARLEPESSTVLVMPGYPTRFEAEIDAEVPRLGIADRVRLPGRVSDEDLEGLYAIASCLVMPSLIEGFGIPVLEAMERGLPVACSTAPSLPEVAGDAARYFDPEDEGEIATAISEVIRDSRLRERLAAAGRERARRFSWERTARQTIESYERAWARNGAQVTAGAGSRDLP
jgi:glycosyltransferase involved in cell wall biosynthesis